MVKYKIEEERPGFFRVYKKKWIFWRICCEDIGFDMLRLRFKTKAEAEAYIKADIDGENKPFKTKRYLYDDCGEQIVYGDNIGR
jgi:hypothetical protein